MTNSLHLTEAELREWTGYVHRPKQAEMLDRWGIKYRVARHGVLKVTREAFKNHGLTRRRAANDDGFNLDGLEAS